ncbi:hypothetical protein PIIN_11385 [Serendipita indica DSM 11827]|uniref:Uncharacterized protein n=1 Tax=Serendipita indica (strain DSM 11827) TaxID=1109443 RepID=G4U1G5_SERID|nr:hypothetical protein PIIN_11385 [Serendipita indica DSM 11827]
MSNIASFNQHSASQTRVLQLDVS